MKNRLEKAETTPITSSKKIWADPELILISKAGLESGTKHTLHEQHFTPKRTHYHLPGGTTIPVVAPKFAAYWS